uniref:Uncharacterized protein n=1 Tax=Solanum tuberosum TaxID=4113 RepID=M1DVR3_SOLTU
MQNLAKTEQQKKGEPQRGSWAVNRTTTRHPRRVSHTAGHGGPLAPTLTVEPHTVHQYARESMPETPVTPRGYPLDVNMGPRIRSDPRLTLKLTYHKHTKTTE